MQISKNTWYESYGFAFNPLSIKPGVFTDYIAGYDFVAKQIGKKITAGGYFLLTGEFGTGKSTILKKILYDLGGKGKVIYYNCNKQEGDIPFEKLLVGAQPWFLRFFKKKHMILFLDEAQDMPQGTTDLLENLRANDYLSAVCFVTNELKSRQFVHIKKLVGKNIYRTQYVTPDQAVTIVRNRIGDLQIISDDQIKRIFAHNKNPRSFLQNIDAVLAHMFEHERKAVSEVDLEIDLHCI